MGSRTFLDSKDMLLAGRCHVLVAPNGGSTYTYTPGAMYHSIALRDAPKKANCSDLPLGRSDFWAKQGGRGGFSFVARASEAW